MCIRDSYGPLVNCVPAACSSLHLHLGMYGIIERFYDFNCWLVLETVIKGLNKKNEKVLYTDRIAVYKKWAHCIRLTITNTLLTSEILKTELYTVRSE